MSAPNVLVVDDEPDIRELVGEILEDEGYRVSTAENGEQARQALRDSKPDLIFLDIWMPELDGITLLKELSENKGLPCPVIMMSGHGTVETAVEATRLGAYDFLEKPISLNRLTTTAKRALDAHRMSMENEGLRIKVGDFVEPVGASAVITRLREQVRRIAQHDSWVLMTGQPGSGRETFARYLHHHSARASQPFIVLNASGVTKGGSAFELFGREQDGKVEYGKLEQAAGGTLFLDEIAELEISAQAQLEAALETGEFLRVGGAAPVKLNARVVAATAKELLKLVTENKFREDLFYQLNVVPIKIPSLAERKEDVPMLLQEAVDRFTLVDRLPFREFSFAAQNFLRDYDWPGNIRELRNMVQRVLILGSDEEVSLKEVQTALGQVRAESTDAMPVGISMDQPMKEAREEFEKLYLEHHFSLAEGNVSRMAQAVGIDRANLYKKLRDRGIEIKSR